MKRAALAALVLPLILSWGSAAFADSRDHRYEGRRDHWSDRDRRDHDRRDGRYDRRHDHRFDRDRWDRRDYRDHRYDRHHRYHAPRYYPPRGYRYYRWHRGDRLPRAYYGRPYIVNDYHVYRLHRPPRGHHWVRVDRDVVLAAVATGVILDVVYNHFY